MPRLKINTRYQVTYKGTTNIVKIVGLYSERVLQNCVKVEIVSSTNPNTQPGWVGGMDKTFLCKHGKAI